MSIKVTNAIVEHLRLSTPDGYPFFTLVNVAKMMTSGNSLVLKLTKSRVSDVIITFDEDSGLYNIEFLSCGDSVMSKNNVYPEEIGKTIHNFLKWLDGEKACLNVDDVATNLSYLKPCHEAKAVHEGDHDGIILELRSEVLMHEIDKIMTMAKQYGFEATGIRVNDGYIQMYLRREKA